MAVVGSIIGSWIIGLAYMLALLFSVQSITSIQTTSYAIPIAQLYHDAIGTRLTLMCLSVICLAQFMAAVTAFTASSRLYYALARDNAFPAKGAFMALNRFQAPYVGIWMSVLIGCVVSCAYIGSVIAVGCSHITKKALTDLLPLSVQCYIIFCCHCCNAQLSAANSYSRILALIVIHFYSQSNISHQSVLLVSKSVDPFILENGHG